MSARMAARACSGRGRNCQSLPCSSAFLEEQGEHVTPTGIAIAAALANTQKPEQATITAVGVGAGKRDFGQPNILRVFQLTTKEEK